MPSLKYYTKKELQIYYQKYRDNNREKIREYNRLYNMVWRKKNGYHNESKWEEDNKYKRLAHYKLRKAIKNGIIKKETCKKCGNKAQGHHFNYRKPLCVIWLCPIHHKEEHLTKK